MSGSERSDGFETSREPEMSSEDAAEAASYFDYVVGAMQ